MCEELAGTVPRNAQFQLSVDPVSLKEPLRDEGLGKARLFAESPPTDPLHNLNNACCVLSGLLVSRLPGEEAYGPTMDFQDVSVRDGPEKKAGDEYAPGDRKCQEFVARWERSELTEMFHPVRESVSARSSVR